MNLLGFKKVPLEVFNESVGVYKSCLEVLDGLRVQISTLEVLNEALMVHK